MTTITLDEITRNAVLAALDERAARLDAESVDAELSVTYLESLNLPVPEDLRRKLVWNIAALHETEQAREIIGEAPAAIDHPVGASWQGMTEGEMAATR